MTRRLKRLEDFELTLEIRNPEFIRPPRDSQRNWLLNRALGELATDLLALDESAARFVPGRDPERIADRSRSDLSDEDIMEDWQVPLMEAMAHVAAESRGDVLEIGFGRGIASGFLQRFGVERHTIVECNPHVVERFESWRQSFPDRDIRMVPGLWQERLDSLGEFDAILFHTYPLDEDEQIELISRSSTFAEHFFPHAALHLKSGGVLTYMTNEIDSLSRAHQRALFRHFSSISLRTQPLTLPDDVRDAWWADSMVVVRAEK